MKERPILFRGDMVRAILDGNKTQTRRAFNERTIKGFKAAAQIGEVSHFIDEGFIGKNDTGYILEFCPYGQVGDRLWVRETFCKVDDTELGGHVWFDYRATPKYAESHPAGWDNDPHNPEALKWKPSIHMPRAASRITLEIVNIRVERLKDVSEEDAKAEGVNGRMDNENNCYWPESYVFSELWESINGAGSWDLNPWVWVIEFKRV